jgi:hypothetical protein
LSTKIHATVDALGNPTGFHLTEGQACELDGADVLLRQIRAGTVIADKGFDAAQRVLEPLQKAGKLAVIPKLTANSSASTTRNSTKPGT